jgi:hypothetical protein
MNRRLRLPRVGRRPVAPSRTGGDVSGCADGTRPSLAGAEPVTPRARRRSRWSSGFFLVATVAAVSGCTSNSDQASPVNPDSQSLVATPSSPSTAQTPDPCPNPDGQACLGRVDAGTYTTTVFQPTLTYTVRAGWANYEDTPGNFLIVPSWATLQGVDPGTSDYIGVYTRVAADSCADAPRHGVPDTITGISHWLARQRTFTSTRPQTAAVGGLHGVVQDLTEVPGAPASPCHNGLPGSPLIVGLAPSDLAHSVVPGLRLRLYLLGFRGGVLAIEVDDIARNHGRDMAALDQVVMSMTFASP